MDIDQYSDVKAVITESLKFKAKLAIGEDAYGTLRLKNKLADYWEIFGGVGTGVAVAKTTVVATTFFAPSGLLGILGFGTAVTPVGWVVAAAVLSGGAVVGVRRMLNDATVSRVTTIPKFINTPIDILAVSLFDLIAPLALKVAALDGLVDNKERNCIKEYFVNGWGYDPHFIDISCRLVESKLDQISVKVIAEKLAEFSKSSPDCNYDEMTRDLMAFLKDVMEANGEIDEREDFALEKINEIFIETGRTFSKANITKVSNATMESLQKGKAVVERGTQTISNTGKLFLKKIVK